MSQSTRTTVTCSVTHDLCGQNMTDIKCGLENLQTVTITVRYPKLTIDKVDETRGTAKARIIQHVTGELKAIFGDNAKTIKISFRWISDEECIITLTPTI